MYAAMLASSVIVPRIIEGMIKVKTIFMIQFLVFLLFQLFFNGFSWVLNTVDVE
jgi:hypothetical protein